MDTYMHVHRLTISLLPADNGGHQDQGIFHYEIPYTSFVLVAMPGVRREVEFQCEREGKDG